MRKISKTILSSALAVFMLTCPLQMSAQGVVKPPKKYTPTPPIPNPPKPIIQKISYDSSRGILTVGDVNYKMIYVAGGTFTMGGDGRNNKPTHSVTLSSYYIGQTEVTQALWKAVMDSNPSYNNMKGDNLPAEMVTWNDCQTFIRKLNAATGKSFRLPTEAEWEYAARGGSKSQGYRCSGSNDIDKVAWYEDNSGDKTHAVATKQANELGIYDMSGNVDEWCSDWYGDYSSASQTDPTGPMSGQYRVIRGGSKRHNVNLCLVSHRGCWEPDEYDIFIGLRLALSE